MVRLWWKPKSSNESPNEAPFASVPAELAYQAAVKAGATITRDQFRAAIQTFTLEQEKSQKRYEEWAKGSSAAVQEVG